MTVRVEAVVVARLVVPVVVRAPSDDCPTTWSVPDDESDEVAVIEPPVIVPPVSVVNTEVIAVRKVEKRFVVVALVARRLVVDASVE